MAQSTIDDDITRIQTQLDALRVKIGKQEALNEVEEGRGFRTSFTDIDKLYKREEILQTRLDTLYRATT